MLVLLARPLLWKKELIYDLNLNVWKRIMESSSTGLEQVLNETFE